MSESTRTKLSKLILKISKQNDCTLIIQLTMFPLEENFYFGANRCGDYGNSTKKTPFKLVVSNCSNLAIFAILHVGLMND